MRKFVLGFGAVGAALIAAQASAAFPTKTITYDAQGRLYRVTARISGYLEADSVNRSDLRCDSEEIWGTTCILYDYPAQYFCPSGAVQLAALTDASEVRMDFAYGVEGDPTAMICHLSIRQSPEIMAESRSLNFQSSAGGSSSTGGGSSTGGSTGGGNFVCDGACLNAIPLDKATSSQHLGGGEAWYVVDNGPIAGWQLSSGEGRSIYVNGVQVGPGQVPITANSDGKYYFRFTPGDYTWATWSWW